MFRTFVCLAVLIVAALAIPPNKEEALKLFKQFQLDYNIHYETEDLENERFGVFQQNLARVEKMNAESRGAVYGITKFFDMTPEEFQHNILNRKGLKHDEFPKADMNSCSAAARFGSDWCSSSIPTSYDWRSYGAVTGVKDQGNCGSCWSFGTTGDVEGTWFLAHNSLVSLSEQQLVSCDKSDSGCNGGLQENAFDYIIRTGGIQSEADYPYTSGTGRVASCTVDTKKFVANISAWAQVSSSASGESNIAPYLYANGPLTIGINANPMQYYVAGIDDPSNCSPLLLNHAVLIVGYGTQNGVDYWLIKNSWGTTWGEQGYYRIVRGKDACGLARDVVHSLI
jgi:cathepsin F